MEYINGGVCAPRGFVAGSTACGIRKHGRRDLALIVSRTRASAAGVYTTNLVKGAPILVTKEHLEDGYAQAIICNSGNANTCNADGIEIAREMCEQVELFSGVRSKDVAVASTGVIGQPLDIEVIKRGMPDLFLSLGYNSSDAAEAIMTTDTVKKEFAIKFMLGGKTVKMGGIAKGSGMIHPNMATMLVFVTTDAAIAPGFLQKALSEVVQDTFNMISVDRDTSTNDTMLVLANGVADNPEICSENEDYHTFKEALHELSSSLCRAIAKDGEGASKLLECRVKGAATDEDARKLAKSVICSPLVKAAMFGSDANWGRVLCALGYAGANMDVNKVAVSFSSAAGDIAVCENGAGLPFSEELAKKILLENEIVINVALGDGSAEAVAYGCDLTYDYVKINGDYRT